MAINVKTSSPTVKVQVGTANAIKVLSSASGGATYSENARNVIGGIASVSQVYVSGVSTFTNSLYVAGITTISGDGGISTSGGDFYVGGDLYVQDDLVLDEISARNLTISGLTSTQNLWVAGIATIGGSTINDGSFDQIKVIGLSTFVGNVIFEGSQNQLNVTGVSTFAGITTVTGDTLFTKQLNVSGIATFHSGVNQLDVIGVSTFKNDVEFHGSSGVSSAYWDASDNSLKFIDNASIKIGNDTNGDLQLFHDGTNSIIRDNVSGAGQLRIVSEHFEIRNSDQSNRVLRAQLSAGTHSVELFTNGIRRLQTTNSGVEITDNLNVAGVSTFAGAIDANGDLDVDGHTELDNVNVSGVSTFAGAIDANGDLDVDGRSELDTVHISETLNVVGISSFGGNVLIGSADLTIDGNTQHSGNVNISQHLNVSGVSTFVGIVTTGNDLYVGGDLYVRDDLVLDEITANNLNITGVSTFAGNAQFDGNVSIAGTLTYEDVTNVDSVGIITAGKGFRATTGGLIVTAGISTFGAIATFAQNVFVDGTLTAGLIDGGTY